MIKAEISAEIVAHSINQFGDELISVLCTFPRIILSEINTHRMLSKNTSSSRAIPFKKMVEAVENDPFIPIAWQKEHKGMQGTEYFTTSHEISFNEMMWEDAKNDAIQRAISLNESKVTKQLANRLLEPFMWTTMLITGPKSGWDNFFHLRCPSYQIKITKPEEFSGKIFSFKSKKDFVKFGNNEELTKDWTDLDWLHINKGQAEIHMMALAEAIYDAVNESTPKQLKAGEYHIPFEDKLKDPLIWKLLSEGIPQPEWAKLYWETKVKISTAMAARTSYTVVGEEKEIDYQKMVDLHDRLLSQDPPHSSPLEHCCRALTDEEYKQFYKGKLYVGDYDAESDSLPMSLNLKDCGWVNNIKGFIPYRYLVDNKLSI